MCVRDSAPPMFLPWPIVVGVRPRGTLPAGTTATDLVLTFTQMLRAHGVVGKFVEFFGPSLSSLGIADRATLSNMSPEFGATSTLFPVDANTLRYLKLAGRGNRIDLVERYTREQGLFRTDADPEPHFSEVLDLDLGKIEPSVAGPKRPRDRVSLSDVRASFDAAFSGPEVPVDGKEIARLVGEGGVIACEAVKAPPQPVGDSCRTAASVADGAVVIAAITSCTNTSNPAVMIAAGLLARKAVEAGLQSRPWVKTSLAPGSRVVTCLLYTSDAADERSSVDLGGRRIIKKKNNGKTTSKRKTITSDNCRARNIT